YLGVLDHIYFERMDPDKFDIIRFKGDLNEYPHAQGHENYIKQLAKYFPEEKDAIVKYIETLQLYCSKFPLYELKKGYKHEDAILSKSCIDVISSLTQNKKLQAVLLGNGFLYGLHADSPFYIHALILNSYIQSSWRCIRGGNQISKAFIKELRKHKAELFNNQEVNKLNFDNDILISCETENCIYEASHFISNISVLKLFKLFDKKNQNKPYVKRISELKEGPSAFSVHLVLKPNIIPYFNYNIYHFDHPNYVFRYSDNWNGYRPKSIIISCSPQ